MRCQWCGLEGCKGHRGNVVSLVIHLQDVTRSIYLVAGICHMFYERHTWRFFDLSYTAIAKKNSVLLC